MIDALSMLAGGGLLAVGYVVGRVRRPRAAVSKPAGPTCGCGHGLHAHDSTQRACTAQQQRSKYNKYGEWVGHEYVPCSCVRYVGPEPLADVWPTPLPYDAVESSGSSSGGTT